MTKIETYKQCVLLRETPTGHQTVVSWIPSNVARENWKIELLDLGVGEFWTVQEVFDTEVSREFIDLNRKARNSLKSI